LSQDGRGIWETHDQSIAASVGYFQDGKLRCASKVGTGFSNAVIEQIIEAAGLIRQVRRPLGATTAKRL
jgi:hypothetical protein